MATPAVENNTKNKNRSDLHKVYRKECTYLVTLSAYGSEKLTLTKQIESEIMEFSIVSAVRADVNMWIISDFSKGTSTNFWQKALNVHMDDVSVAIPQLNQQTYVIVPVQLTEIQMLFSTANQQLPNTSTTQDVQCHENRASPKRAQ